jgi:ATP-dependent Clp protease protease subunit
MARLLAVLFLLGCVTPRSVTADEPVDVVQVDHLDLALYGPVGAETVLPLMDAIEAFQPRTVTLRIDSPGGSVGAGLALVDTMRNAQRHGTAFVCVVDGWAASMAAYILQTCDLRLMTRQSAVMFHTVSLGHAEGNQWDFERLARRMAGVNKMLSIFIAGRLGMPLAEYEARVDDRDWWLGYEEALAVGAIDGVL